MLIFFIEIDRPWRKAMLMDVEVLLKPKTAWAVAPNGRRYKLGSSAFQTREAADRRRKALLEVIRKSYYIERHQSPLWTQACEALALIAREQGL